VETLTTGAGNDILVGNSKVNVLDSGAGIDSIDGKGGLDSCLHGETLLNCP